MARPGLRKGPMDLQGTVPITRRGANESSRPQSPFEANVLRGVSRAVEVHKLVKTALRVAAVRQLAERNALRTGHGPSNRARKVRGLGGLVGSIGRASYEATESVVASAAPSEHAPPHSDRLAAA